MRLPKEVWEEIDDQASAIGLRATDLAGRVLKTRFARPSDHQKMAAENHKTAAEAPESPEWDDSPLRD